MGENVDPGNKSQDQIEDEAWACFRLRAEGRTIKEIAFYTGLSRETCKRRLSMSILSHSAPPRDFQKAASELRMEIYTQEVISALGRSGEDPGSVAKLVSSGVQIERRRAQLHGLDEPTASRVTVNNVTPSDFEGRRPVWMTDDMAKWRASDLYRDDLAQAGRELDD